MNEALLHYTSDGSRQDEPRDGAHRGAAGGSACGDMLQISLLLDPAAGISEPRWQAKGCAAARAAAAATCELLDGATLGEAALLNAVVIEEELGGLSPVGVHAAALAADALHRALGAAALSGEPLLAPPTGSSTGDGGERVLVAMSGGVDSAVAALLEQREHSNEVFAVTLELWSDPANDGEQSCCSPQAVRLARSVAHSMGIPHLTVDLRDRFRAGVVEPFLDGYAAGSTPNPCVRCNGRVRIEPMIEIAGRLGAAGLATGHYAQIIDDGQGCLLSAATDEAKDQVYMLSALPIELLSRMRFPLGGLRKPEVRELAAGAGLPVAGRPESQDLCFLAGEGKAGFLRRHGGLAAREGEIVDSEGAVLGRHDGHHNFTVGQRRGIRLGAPEPLYVLATDADSNRVTVGVRGQLDRSAIEVTDPVLYRNPERVSAVKLRYRSRPIGCRVEAGESGAGAGEVVLRLSEAVSRPAPGQTAVLLDGEVVVGHATIA